MLAGKDKPKAADLKKVITAGGGECDDDAVAKLLKELEGKDKYMSICTGANGKLYAPPYNATKVLEIDPVMGDVNESGDPLPGKLKYMCIASASNGRLYSPPSNASKVLEIDPEDQQVKEIGDVLPGEDKYWCILAGLNGKLHAPPHSAGSVLEIRAYGLPNLGEHLALAGASSEFADIEVVVGDVTFNGHRVVLARIPFFAATFRAGMSECESRRIEVGDVDPEAFHAVWRAAYSDDLRFVFNITDVDLLGRILPAAQRFEMTELQEAAAAHLAKVLTSDLTPQTAASWLVMTRRYNAPAAEKACLSYIREHGEQVLLAEMMQNGGPRNWSGDEDTCKVLVEAATFKSKNLPAAVLPPKFGHSASV